MVSVRSASATHVNERHEDPAFVGDVVHHPLDSLDQRENFIYLGAESEYSQEVGFDLGSRRVSRSRALNV